MTTTGSHRWCDQHGREWALQTIVRKQVRQAGQRWKARGCLFKDAGWRVVDLLALWQVGAQEALVVVTDLREGWSVLRLYDRRFWCEPGFRNDKRKGWQWEASQVQGVLHHDHLLLGMAWASLIALCVGVQVAQARLAQVAGSPRRRALAQPRHARESVFTRGVRALRRWLYHRTRAPLPWHLPEVDAISWERRWHQCQALRLIFGQPVRP